MKVVIYCSKIVSQKKSGVHWYSYNLIHNLAKIDKDNLYILYGIKGKYKDLRNFIPQQENFYIRRCYFPIKFLPLEFSTGKVDLVHLLYSAVFPVIKAKRIVTIHGLISFIEGERCTKWSVINPERQKRKRERMEVSIRKADKIIAVSENTKADIIKYFSIDPSKIAVVYEGKSDIFRPLQYQENMKGILNRYNISKRFILTTGTHSPRKNLARLLLSFEKVRRKDDCQLVIFGNIKRKGEWFETFSRLPSDIKDDVLLTGYIPLDDLPYLYSAAEFFIYPSLYEGFGLPILEAIACGCPVITSNTSSLPEVAGDAGILIDPYNVDEMAERMEELFLDERLREQLRVKGLERTKLFTWEKTARETLKVYEEVYNGK